MPGDGANGATNSNKPSITTIPKRKRPPKVPIDQLNPPAQQGDRPFICKSCKCEFPSDQYHSYIYHVGQCAYRARARESPPPLPNSTSSDLVPQSPATDPAAASSTVSSVDTDIPGVELPTDYNHLPALTSPADDTPDLQKVLESLREHMGWDLPDTTDPTIPPPPTTTTDQAETTPNMLTIPTDPPIPPPITTNEQGEINLDDLTTPLDNPPIPPADQPFFYTDIFQYPESCASPADSTYSNDVDFDDPVSLYGIGGAREVSGLDPVPYKSGVLSFSAYLVDDLSRVKWEGWEGESDEE
ncbi:hypothetical protein HDV00_004970 [Rhizophlyctis rosea]|nr:hypothetical protein HDV00_004970 [Rhizophlyctis rosea]